MKIFTRAKEALLLSDTTPEVTALSMAVGVALAFSPLPGLQFVIAIILNHWWRLNAMVVIVGILVHNPWTFIPIHLGGIVIGDLILYGSLESMEHFRAFPWGEMTLFNSFSPTWWKTNWPLFMKFFRPFWWGHWVMAAVMAGLSYWLTLKFVHGHNNYFRNLQAESEHADKDKDDPPSFDSEDHEDQVSAPDVDGEDAAHGAKTHARSD
ncbi:DUF2062 domain-containing protein [Acanthopleuribacter pedis]|uniref:DUF2062 domain-containing protein n=1 Tax=Acanthopleuribacter pedis TaxID=442870 RepID=A0A8J7U2F3_9BACT|nr:DUF2062 domain-containing protein [Acanthopleuribacter pedis]MBO1317654.1 DUF2062 domain-containing protein [Acanthopleuribacter pedis]